MAPQANMIALVGALLITIALSAPLAVTLEDFDMLAAKWEGPTCAFQRKCNWSFAARARSAPGGFARSRLRGRCMPRTVRLAAEMRVGHAPFGGGGVWGTRRRR